MDISKANTAQRIIKHTFANRSLIIEALQAPGSCITRLDGRDFVQGNYHLAEIGACVATLIITERCYKNGASSASIHSTLLSRLSEERLAELCDSAELTICINPRFDRPFPIENHTKAATVKAIIAAVYKDQGLELAEQTMAILGLVRAKE